MVKVIYNNNYEIYYYINYISNDRPPLLRRLPLLRLLRRLPQLRRP